MRKTFLINLTCLFLGTLMVPFVALAEDELYSTFAEARRVDISDEQKASLIPGDDASESVHNGFDLYERKCAYCHDAGVQKSGTLRLNDRYEGDVTRSVLALRKDLVPEVITVFVRTKTVGMPPFRIVELTDAELDDLIAYLTRNN